MTPFPPEKNGHACLKNMCYPRKSVYIYDSSNEILDRSSKGEYFLGFVLLRDTISTMQTHKPHF